ncbi:MAG: glycerol acyltransferase [Candidatus Symbiothrix sp.]|nr:glycerol acyltransferase [Candidatus Symbiothrix sp.]
MDEEKAFRVDLDEILRTKAPKIYRKIPRFLIRLLEWIIDQKQLNHFFALSAGLTGVDFMENSIRNFGLTIHLKGTEKLPEADRPCIFASNHPLGGLDGVVLSAVLGKHYNGKIRYLVNDILYFIDPLKDIFIPINKHGAQGKAAALQLNEAFVSENQIITFPAGLCSRKIKGKIRDLDWKKNFISKAIEYQRDVVPVYFEARNSNFFYNLANIRKLLSLKFNIEMLFLPREMFKAKHSVFTIHFGEAISWQYFDKSKTPQQWAKTIENEVYNTLK